MLLQLRYRGLTLEGYIDIMKSESSVKNFFQFFFGFWGIIALSLLIIGSVTYYEFTTENTAQSTIDDRDSHQ